MTDSRHKYRKSSIALSTIGTALGFAGMILFPPATLAFGVFSGAACGLVVLRDYSDFKAAEVANSKPSEELSLVLLELRKIRRFLGLLVCTFVVITLGFLGQAFDPFVTEWVSKITYAIGYAAVVGVLLAAALVALSKWQSEQESAIAYAAKRT